MKVKGILVDVYNNKINPIELNYKSIDDLYKILRCNVISTLYLEFNGVESYCIFDDVGKYKSGDSFVPSALLINKNSGKVIDYIVGNLFICSVGRDKICSLDDFQIMNILATKTKCSFFNFHKDFNVLVSLGDYIEF